MEYLGLLFDRYQLEWKSLTTALDDYMHVVKAFIPDYKYKPCYNITRFIDFPIYGFVILVKVFILAHGVIDILPKWVSLTLFPTLIAYYHMYLSTSAVVRCKFNQYNFASIWVLLWQFPYRAITPTNMMLYSGSSVFFVCIEAVYLGCQFAIDVFIIISTLWFLVKSFLRRSFNVSFVIAACAIFYLQQDRGPQVPEVFYIFLFLIVMGVYAVYTLDRGTNDEMIFFVSTVIGITLLLNYKVMIYGFTAMESSKAGQEVPFKRLPVYYLDREVPWNLLKDQPSYLDKLKNLTPIMKETAEEIGDPRPIYIDVFPLPTPKHEEPVSEAAELEIESIILEPDDDVSTNFSAVKDVKYRNNETLPTMLY